MPTTQIAAVLSEATSAESAGEVALSRNGRFAVVRLARPDALNALRFQDWQRLGEVFRALVQDDDLRVVILCGTGRRAFSAGADIREFAERRMPARRAEVYNEVLADALTAVMGCRIPVLAMIRGLAVGGGCELAAACDLRIASDDVRIGIPIGRLGVTLGEVEARAVGRLIGSARLKDLVFTGRLVDAGEALSIGLLDRAVPAQSLVEATSHMVEAIMSAAPVTIRATKLVADLEGSPASGDQAVALERLTSAAYDGEHLKEGITAFLDNRAPRFEP
jgi:enoyl-CoA hydratase